MTGRITGLRREVLSALYWPFMIAMGFGFVDAIDSLIPPPIGTAGPMLPSWQIGLLIGTLGAMGCVSIILAGAGAREAEAKTAQPLGFRIWVWIAHGGFVVGIVAGFLVSVLLRLQQTNTMILMFFAGLAMTVTGIGGVLLREWIVRRRQRLGALPAAGLPPNRDMLPVAKFDGVEPQRSACLDGGRNKGCAS